MLIKIQCKQCGKEVIREWRNGRPKPKYCDFLCFKKYGAGGKARRKYILSPERKKAILQAHKKGMTGVDLSKTDLFTSIPSKIINQWFRELGLGRGKGGVNSWTKEEEEMLIKLIEKYSIRTISKKMRKAGFCRSNKSIEKKLKRMKIETKPDIYNAAEVAEIFRCGETTVIRWIRSGKLKGKQETKGGTWYIFPKDIAHFIRSYPFLVDEFRPDIPFLVAILDEYRIKSSRN